MRIVGVTGTNGKTTCVELICQLLKTKLNCASFGTLGVKHYQDGGCLEKKTKLTTLGNVELHENLLEVSNNKCQIVAMEVSSHGLDQKRVAGVHFSDAIFTNLSQDHLDYHTNMENYFQAKIKLFTEYSQHLQRAIINLDDDYGLKIIQYLLEASVHQELNEQKNKLEIIGFSTRSLEQQSTDHFLRNIKIITCNNIKYYESGIKACVFTPWGEGEFKIGLMGKHNLSNLLASIAASVIYLPFSEILEQAKNLKPVIGRLQKISNINTNIIIDYAHTPDALEKALFAISQHYPGKKICCIFGCGGDRDQGKRPKMLEIADQYCSSIVITQDNSRFEDPQKIINDILSYKNTNLIGNLLIEMDRKTAIHLAVEKYSKDHIILIAGKGHENKQIIGDNEHPFCDYTVAQEASLAYTAAYY